MPRTTAHSDVTVTDVTTTVARRDVHSNYLSGTIPVSIGDLSALLQLCGDCANAIAPSHNLMRRDVSTNQLTGTIPSSIGYVRRCIRQLLQCDSHACQFNGRAQGGVQDSAGR